ncbi:hypothetical protein T439DRAFT_219551 [Meredithblackwellia eburnea MCA 4105]
MEVAMLLSKISAKTRVFKIVVGRVEAGWGSMLFSLFDPRRRLSLRSGDDGVLGGCGWAVQSLIPNGNEFLMVSPTRTQQQLCPSERNVEWENTTQNKKKTEPKRPRSRPALSAGPLGQSNKFLPPHAIKARVLPSPPLTSPALRSPRLSAQISCFYRFRPSFLRC